MPKYVENGVEQNLVMFDSIDQLEGKTIRVMLKIHSARGLPVKYAGEVQCKYKWIDEKAEEHQTEINTSKSINPDFNYEKDHDLFVSPFVISHIWEGALAIGVYGKMSQENIDQILKITKEKPAAINMSAAKALNLTPQPGSPDTGLPPSSVPINKNFDINAEHSPTKLKEELVMYRS